MYDVEIINGITKETVSATIKRYQFPTLVIEVDTASDSMKVLRDSWPAKVVGFAEVVNPLGATDIEGYVDALAVNNFFFSAGLGRFGALVIVNGLEDFPQAESGIITLEPGRAYYIATLVDLQGARIRNRQDTYSVNCIFSCSPEIGQIQSTGLASGTPLIESNATFPLNHVGLRHDNPFLLDTTGNPNADRAIDWTGVNIYEASAMTVRRYNNAIFNLMGFLNSGGLLFDGEIGTVAFADSIFSNKVGAGATSITIPPSANITRRIRIKDSSFISLAGETALDVSPTAIANNESVILKDCFFSGGGTYLAPGSVMSADVKARFSENRGISNSGTLAFIYMKGNATPTTFSAPNAPTKILGTTITDPATERFTGTDNRATASGAITRKYQAEAIVTASSSGGAGVEVSIYIAKNGVVVASSKQTSTTNSASRSENIPAKTIVELSPGDYVEVWMENNTNSTAVTAVNLDLFVIPVPA